MNTTIPAGFRQNSAGHLVPEESISEMDKTRDALVGELIDKARDLNGLIRDFKTDSMGDVQAFIALAAEKYGAKVGGAKGNISLLSFDGRRKVEVNVQDSIAFGEELHAAKALIDNCIHRWTEGGRPEVKALVEHAFQTDKQGKLNYGRIFTLMRLQIEDEEWRRAMQALKDSIKTVGSKTYIRFYERRGADQPFTQIAVDSAAA
ncbi:DUF3164 family protein [Methylogaea oryzae]|uniref:Sulfate transporter n=1 Tax=Methylogaea oryzae TaxID=1295382 RepID=A0A8D4VLL6_9GAMM|nr:DUF3164 family protein [Methylogaea oryzae]BBL70358.1 sulfate transporter [Methylogaea oryzae]